MAKRLVMTNGASARGGVAAALLLKRQAAEQPETACELWTASEGQACAFLRGLLGNGRYSSVQFLDFPQSEELVLVHELHLAAVADGSFSFSRPSACAGDDLVREIGLLLHLPAVVVNPIRALYGGEGEHTYPKLFDKAAQLYNDTGETVLFYRLVRRLAEEMDAAKAALKEAHWLKLVGLPCVFGRTLLDEARRHCFELEQDPILKPHLDELVPELLKEMWDSRENCWKEVVPYLRVPYIPQNRRENLRFSDEDGTTWLPEAYDFSRSRLVGHALATERLRHELERANRAPAVTVVGERGTGLEAIARRLHCGTQPSFSKFFAYDCTGAERDGNRLAIFGREKNQKHYNGLLDRADGGTLFLTGIADMDFELQGHLRNFLETREFRHFGSAMKSYSTARIIVAVDKPLEELVTEGRLRPELAMRLSMCRLTLPSLRERKEDIALIANDFWKSNGLGKLTDDQIRALEAYDYPDNDYELLTLLQRAAITDESDFGQLMAGRRALVKRPPVIAQAGASVATVAPATPAASGPPPISDGQLGNPRFPLADIVRLHAYGVYQALGRRKREAARALGISFNTFNKYLDETKTTTTKQGE